MDGTKSLHYINSFFNLIHLDIRHDMKKKICHYFQSVNRNFNRPKVRVTDWYRLVFNCTFLLFCCSHIMEHLEGVIEKPESDMTPQELQLHYFKMHDYDGNNLLDGLELATAITHVHREVRDPALSLTLDQFKARTHLSLSLLHLILWPGLGFPGKRRWQPANEGRGSDQPHWWRSPRRWQKQWWLHWLCRVCEISGVKDDRKSRCLTVNADYLWCTNLQHIPSRVCDFTGTVYSCFSITSIKYHAMKWRGLWWSDMRRFVCMPSV